MHGVIAHRGFAPTDYAGCVCWLRSDLGITTGGLANTVQYWKSQAGTASDAGGTNTTAPSLISGVKGIPALAFDGGHTLLWNLRLSGSKTIAYVIQLTKEDGSGMSIFTISNQAQTLASEDLVDLAGYQFWSFIDDTASATAMGTSNDWGTSLVRGCLRSWDSGGTYDLQLDGADLSITSSGQFGRSVPVASCIGGRTTDGNFYLYGNLYEVVAWNRVLSMKEKLGWWGYVKNRYGR